LPARPSIQPVPPHLVGRVLLGAWLLVVWLALWGTVTPANVIGGVAIAAAVQLIPLPARDMGFAFRPLRVLHFVAYFAGELVRASLVVAREVATPRNRIRTGVVAVPLRGASDALVTLVAAAVTLTPGTLTLEARRDPPTLYVHVLHLDDVESVRRSIRRTEVLAVRAFGSPEAVAGLAVDDTEVVTDRPRGDGP
jgi:multicomponent Na+:H+ antiporter subunit E